MSRIRPLQALGTAAAGAALFAATGCTTTTAEKTARGALEDGADVGVGRQVAELIELCGAPHNSNYFGLKPLRAPGPEDLDDVINERYEKASIILTSNRDRAEWPELFGEALLASAALERLTHGAHFVEITGRSFRAEHTKKQVTARRTRAAS